MTFKPTSLFPLMLTNPCLQDLHAVHMKLIQTPTQQYSGPEISQSFSNRKTSQAPDEIVKAYTFFFYRVLKIL